MSSSDNTITTDVFSANEQRKYSPFIVALLFCGIFIIGLQAIKTTYDNDVWWLIATGREIVQNGFPRTNPWAIHDGMKIVIQQWIPSVLLYGAYSFGGFPAIEAMLVIEILVFIWILWKLCRYCSGGKEEIALAAVLVAFISMSRYFSARPQIFSMMFYLLIIYVLEKYRKTHDKQKLLFLPLITLLHVNFHASMVVLDFFIMGVYWIPDFSKTLSKHHKVPFSFGEADYKRTPLFIAAVVSGLTMLLNPYGIKGALYLFESYGAASYGNSISEMNPLVMYSAYGIADLILIITGSIIIGVNGRKIDLPHTCLFITSAFLTIQHIRNCWLVALFSLALIMRGIHDFSVPEFHIRVLQRKAVRFLFVFVLADVMFIYAYANIWPTFVEYINISKSDTFDFPQKAADWLENYAAENGIEKSEIRLFNTFNNGGLLEYRGFKVLMDPRPELWEPPITGLSEHYYQEYVDFQADRSKIPDMLTKYDYDFYIVREDSATEDYLIEHTEKYKVVEEGNGYKLWTDLDE